MKRTFGHRHLGFIFRPLVTLTDSGFTFRGRSYDWQSIRGVRAIDPRRDLSFIFTNWPRAMVQLSDGRFILLNGRALEEQGNKPHVGFWSRRSDAYEELLSIFRNHTGQPGKPGDGPRAESTTS